MTDENLPRKRLRRSPEPAWLLPVLDVVLALIAFALAYVARYELQILRPVFDPNRAEFAPYLPYAAVYVLLLHLHFRGSGLYRNVRGRAWLEEAWAIANGITNATVILLGLFFVLQPLVFSRLMLLYVAVNTVVLLTLARLIRRLILANLRAKGIGVQRVLIVGFGDVGQAVLRTMVARTDLGYIAVGYLDDNPNRGTVDLGRVRGFGGLDKLAETIRAQYVDLVIVTLPWKHHARIIELIDIAGDHGVGVRVVPDVFQLNLRQVQIENLDGIPLLGVDGRVTFHASSRLIKRALDVGVIVLISPVILLLIALIALAIRLEGRGSVFYKQRRIGENGREFDMIKFRSMIPDADRYREQLVKETGEDPRHPKIRDDPRITRVGRFIRRASLDELPNFINVLRGQMSLVGPRPPTPDEVSLYQPWHMQRLQIMPGITGLWQVSGRSEVPFEEMVLLDIYYIENWSIRLDAQILFRTLPRVLFQQGAY